MVEDGFYCCRFFNEFTGCCSLYGEDKPYSCPEVSVTEYIRKKDVLSIIDAENDAETYDLIQGANTTSFFNKYPEFAELYIKKDDAIEPELAELYIKKDDAIERAPHLEEKIDLLMTYKSVRTFGDMLDERLVCKNFIYYS